MAPGIRRGTARLRRHDGRADRYPDACGFDKAAWRSRDRGATWQRLRGYTFKWGHRVMPDPLTPDMVYVTTFGGGLWHGPAAGDPASHRRYRRTETALTNSPPISAATLDGAIWGGFPVTAALPRPFHPDSPPLAASDIQGWTDVDQAHRAKKVLDVARRHHAGIGMQDLCGAARHGVAGTGLDVPSLREPDEEATEQAVAGADRVARFDDRREHGSGAAGRVQDGALRAERSSTMRGPRSAMPRRPRRRPCGSRWGGRAGAQPPAGSASRATERQRGRVPAPRRSRRAPPSRARPPR